MTQIPKVRFTIIWIFFFVATFAATLAVSIQNAKYGYFATCIFFSFFFALLLRIQFRLTHTFVSVASIIISALIGALLMVFATCYHLPKEVPFSIVVRTGWSSIYQAALAGIVSGVWGWILMMPMYFIFSTILVQRD